MSFVNLKLSKKKGGNKVPEAITSEGPDYSYGTRISLDKETIGKLGIDISKIKVGDNATASVKMEVVSVRQEAGKDYNSESIELQITDIDMGKFGKSASKEKLARFNAIKNESPTQE
jgi:hypothetical protein